MTADFLQTFFGPGNDVLYNDLVGGRWGEHGATLEPWIERLRSRQATLLPRLRGEDLYWYGLAHTPDEVEDLRTSVFAWVGLSYSDFTGRPPVQAFDTFDDSVSEHTSGNWFVLRVAPGRAKDVRVAIDRMRRLHESRPNLVGLVRPPLGRLLRDFDWALQQRDPERSIDLLAAIQVSGQVSAMNVSYLRVRRLSTLGLIDELLASPDLPDVVLSQRPRAVTSAILEALYNRYIEELAESSRVDEALTAFSDHIIVRYGSLFSGLTPKPTTGELRLQLLRSVLEPQKPELRDEVMAAAVRLNLQDPFLEEVSNLVSNSHREAATLEAVRRALTNGAAGEGLALLQQVIDGRQHAELAIEVALELDQPQAAEYALGLINGLRPEDRTALEHSRLYRRPVDQLRGLASAPSTWLALLRMIVTNEATQSNIDQAREHWDAWSVEALVEDTPAVEQLLLGEKNHQADALLRSVLPQLTDVLIGRPNAAADQRIHTILTAFVFVLKLADGRSPGDLESLLDLADQLIPSSSGEDYRQLVTDLIEVWTEEDSLRRLPWLVDLAEIVAGHPRRDLGAAAEFAEVFASVVRRRRDQMTPDQLDIAVGLLGELGHEATGLGLRDAGVEVEAPAIPSVLPAAKIAVYTLTPGVGERVQTVLSERAPALDVRINNDTHATEQLVSLAREADVFVVVTRSATHAATDAIRRARPEGRPVIYSGGKGSTSVLAALTEAFPSLAAS